MAQILKTLLVLTFTLVLAACSGENKSGEDTPANNGGDKGKTEEIDVGPMCDRTAQDNGFRVPNFELPAAFNEIKVMAYNAENLFDTVHDEGHDEQQRADGEDRFVGDRAGGDVSGGGLTDKRSHRQD